MSEQSLANVRPLHRIRVLVAASDRRYLRVASFLLMRAGFDVDSCSENETLERVADRRPDVVVLDASTSLGMTARLKSALTARHGELAIVLVSDRPRESQGPLRLLPKWRRGESLVEEVERAYLRLSSDEGLLRGTD